MVTAKQSEALKKGLYTAFEWNDRKKYDLSKTEPDYMKGRMTLDNKLEDEIDCQPFMQIELKDHERTVGYFKGLIAFKVTDSKIIHIFLFSDCKFIE